MGAAVIGSSPAFSTSSLPLQR